MVERNPVSRQRPFRTRVLAVVVLAIWLGLLFDPAWRGLMLAGGSLVVFGMLAVGAAMGLGYLGIGLDRALTRPLRDREREESEWPDFSPRAETIPAAKPSGPGRLARLAPGSLVAALAVVFLLSITGDHLGLLRPIFGGLILLFGVGVVLTLLAGVTVAAARGLRGMAHWFGTRGEPEGRW